MTKSVPITVSPNNPAGRNTNIPHLSLYNIQVSSEHQQKAGDRHLDSLPHLPFHDLLISKLLIPLRITRRYNIKYFPYFPWCRCYKMHAKLRERSRRVMFAWRETANITLLETARLLQERFPRKRQRISEDSLSTHQSPQAASAKLQTMKKIWSTWWQREVM